MQDFSGHIQSHLIRETRYFHGFGAFAGNRFIRLKLKQLFTAQTERSMVWVPVYK